MAVRSITELKRRRVETLRDQNRRRREALKEMVQAVNEIIARDDLEIRNLLAQLEGEAK